MTKITIGTRTSRLALWQTNTIKELLGRLHPDIVVEVRAFVTKGDRHLDTPLPLIGGKGLFTAELEAALRDGRIDLAVHSLKDLPVEDTPGLALGAICHRRDVRDVLIARNGWTLDTLPAGSVVGTSSPRRRAQLLRSRPDLAVRPIRGNIDTRIGKVHAGRFDAVVLAAAGVQRLDLEASITDWLPLNLMLPAPGQGALAVQCRAEDAHASNLLATVDEADTRTTTTAERAFLAGLGSGCSLPVAAHATIEEHNVHLTGRVFNSEGSSRVAVDGRDTDPRRLGARLAREALAGGAAELLP